MALSSERYRVGTLEKGLSVLEAVERSAQPLTIQEIVRATGIQRVAVYRLLCTLEQRGYIARLENKKYRSMTRRRRVLLGYNAPLTGTPFRIDVTASVRQAAAEARVDLLVLNNSEADAEEAVHQAQVLLDAKADVALMFQPAEAIGHVVADRFFSAGMPFITIERPIHGGVYFGANNYQAGKMAGEALGRFALDCWKGRFDRVVLLEAGPTGTNVQARVAGVLVGLRAVAGRVEESQVVHLDGGAHLESSREEMMRLLRKVKPGTRLLVSGFNDRSAVGALEAVREAGRERDVAIVGQNATREGRAEIRNPESRLIASVAYFPERYGARLVRLALQILDREQVPPAVYTDHVLLDAHNVSKYYPGD
ncbi:MAG: substrate-binding domain-containing protein [Acidobacteria bacterium]|nr:substrate-binding domain-containing protein [Acidobacteriota bacterium]